jgi:hypothetical protein
VLDGDDGERHGDAEQGLDAAVDEEAGRVL